MQSRKLISKCANARPDPTQAQRAISSAASTPVVEVVNRMTNVQWLFRSRYFAVVDSTGTAVFRVRHTRSGSRETLDWFVKPALADCARNIDFNVEIDPDNAAPPCPT